MKPSVPVEVREGLSVEDFKRQFLAPGVPVVRLTSIQVHALHLNSHLFISQISTKDFNYSALTGLVLSPPPSVTPMAGPQGRDRQYPRSVVDDRDTESAGRREPGSYSKEHQL